MKKNLLAGFEKILSEESVRKVGVYETCPGAREQLSQQLKILGN